MGGRRKGGGGGKSINIKRENRNEQKDTLNYIS